MQGAVERLYSVQQIAVLFHISTSQVRKLFRDRPGVVTLGGPGKPAWRIPQSLVLQVLAEHGYAPDKALENAP